MTAAKATGALLLLLAAAYYGTQRCEPGDTGYSAAWGRIQGCK